MSATNTNQTYPINASTDLSRLKISLDPPLVLGANSLYKLEIMRWSMLGNLRNVTPLNNKVYYVKSGVPTTATLAEGMTCV